MPFTTIKLAVRYTILIAYTGSVFALAFYAIIRSASLPDLPECTIFHGLNRNTDIVYGMSVSLWLGVVVYHYKYFRVQMRVLYSTLLPSDTETISQYSAFMGYHLLLFVISICYLPNLLIHYYNCDRVQCQLLIAIHSINILPVVMYILFQCAKTLLLGFLGAYYITKRLIFRLYTPPNTRIRYSPVTGYTVEPITATDNLQTRPPSRLVEMATLGGDTQCPICMEDNVPVMVKLACQHTMCIKCCQSWLSSHSTCPFCRGGSEV